MITKIWLKGKTKGEDAIEYPNCYPDFNIQLDNFKVIQLRKESDNKLETGYLMEVIARIEFRP